MIRTAIMMIVLMALGLGALGNIVTAAAIPTIRITGTDGHDEIYINEIGDEILVNSVEVSPDGYDGALAYKYTVNTGKGGDVVHILDSAGDDIYVITAGDGEDFVGWVDDGAGNDMYKFSMGKGNDEIYIRDSSTTDNYRLVGGAGLDMLYYEGMTSTSDGEGGKVSIRGVEILPM